MLHDYLVTTNMYKGNIRASRNDTPEMRNDTPELLKMIHQSRREMTHQSYSKIHKNVQIE